MSLGLYLHIPYCFSKCRYCDFYSAPGQRGVPRAYVDALLRELSRFAPDAPLRPDTLYFGGGTPSLLAPADAARLIDAAQPLPGAEITLEANPETVTEASLRAFRAAGVNRISFGVQSARDSQLKTLGRPHTAKQARAAFAAARRAGFENISGDIMLALPHYTQAEFDETLELIEEGGATHISAYLLKIEPDSAFGRTPPEGLPTSDEAADFYLYAVEQLEHHGYRQYEISNFARPNRYSRHNSSYWQGIPYIGLGPSAHSYDKKSRQWNIASIGSYIKAIQEGQLPFEREELSVHDQYDDYIITRTRTSWGLNPSEILTLFGQAYHDYFMCQATKAQTKGLLEIHDGNFRLTRAGIFISDSVMVELLSE